MDNYSTLFNNYKDDSFLKKLENYSLWTIPSVFPQDETISKGNQSIEHDYQSYGAMLVNNLAPKLAKLLFPFKQAFFNINPTDKLQSAVERATNEGIDWKSTLAALEREACQHVFVDGAYAKLIEVVRDCIITGNCLLVRKPGKTYVYTLRNYAVKRGNTGELLDMIIKERISHSELPEQLRVLLNGGADGTKVFELYTRVKRMPAGKYKVYEVTQQLDGHNVDGVEYYPENMCPYIPVVWTLRDGEAYGRGLVESLAGSFAKLSDMNRALAEYELEALRIIPLVSPASGTDIDTMTSAVTGQAVQGKPTDIQAYESGLYQKIGAISQDLDMLKSELNRAFMYQGSTRQGERVTATEIEFNAAEADQALGGAVSTLSKSVHLTLAHLLLMEVEPSFIAALLAEELRIEITAGVPALGRSADVENLVQATQVLAAILPALTQSSKRFDPERIIDKVLYSYNITPKDIMRTADELKALNQMNDTTMAQADPLNNVNAIGAIQ